MRVALPRHVIGELVFRFLIGGAIVSTFAVIGELFQPKSFSGMFGAPSVAIATLALAFAGDGPHTVRTEATWMLVGCAALLAYTSASIAMMRRNVPVWLAAISAWLAWGAVAAIGRGVLA
jgi:hypothetical protein